MSLSQYHWCVRCGLASCGLFVFCLTAWSDVEPLRMLGPTTCATATCHGGISGVGPAWRFSARIWETDDRHADAGVMLQTPESRQIVNLLSPAARDDEQAFFAVLRNRCISCHASVTREDVEMPTSEMANHLPDLLRSGVSCEACHGPASQWIDVHVLESFAGPERFKQAAGMRDLESWQSRIDACMRCHVGSRSADGLIRDVNHDLIAAGHPELRFDPSWYSSWMPVHWEAATEKSESQIRLFAIGRRRLLAAATVLSQERLADHLAGHDDVVMPELAEYDCRACHSSISTNSSTSPVSRGEPNWNPWYLAGLSNKVGRAESLRLSSETSQGNLEQRQQLLEKIRVMANQAAEKTSEEPTLATLREVIKGVPTVTNEYEALVWCLRLRMAWQDPVLRKSVPNAQVNSLEAIISTISGDLLRLGASGESLLSPAIGFQRERFLEQRRKLLLLLDDVAL